MHRVVQEQIERMIANKRSAEATDSGAATAHLAECKECRTEMRAMQEHAGMLRQLRPPQGFEDEPRGGFYARVMERIEAEGPVSIWNLFMESPFGRRIAVASLALAVVLGVYLVSSEHTADDPIIARSAAQGQVELQAPGDMTIQVELNQIGPDQLWLNQADALAGNQAGNQMEMQQGQLPIAGASFAQPAEDDVLSNLMTYREQ